MISRPQRRKINKAQKEICETAVGLEAVLSFWGLGKRQEKVIKEFADKLSAAAGLLGKDILG